MAHRSTRFVAAMAVVIAATGCAVKNHPTATPEALAREALAAVEAGEEDRALEVLSELEGKVHDPAILRLIAQARFRLAARCGKPGEAAEALSKTAAETRR